MGKVQFPLVNIRRDAVNNWHLHHIENEFLEIPETADEWGFYTVSLAEVPTNGTSGDGSSSPKITGFTEYKGNPINSRTGGLNLSSKQFYVNYSNGALIFHPSQAGKKLYVDYYAKGSLIEVEDINYLYYRLLDVGSTQIIPTFTSFAIENVATKVEVGQKFPIGNQTPVPVTFSWNIDKMDQVQENSISIMMGDTSILSGISPSLRQINFNISQQKTFAVPTNFTFTIRAIALNGSNISRTFDVQWVDKIFYGLSTDKTPTAAKISTLSNMLLDSADPVQKVNINLPGTEISYKMIVVPERYPITKVVDNATDMGFVLDNPISINLTNQHGTTIPYFVYYSTYKIASNVKLSINLGE